MKKRNFKLIRTAAIVTSAGMMICLGGCDSSDSSAEQQASAEPETQYEETLPETESEPEETADPEIVINDALTEYLGSSDYTIYIEDYDCDGNLEAYAYTGDMSVDDWGDPYYENVSLYFIDANGTVDFIYDGLCGWMGNNESLLYAYSGEAFFVWEISGGGSSTSSEVFGVCDGSPMQPSIVGDHGAQGFCQSSDSTYDAEGYYDDFTNGHDYITTYYGFDSADFLFIEADSGTSSASSSGTAAATSGESTTFETLATITDLTFSNGTVSIYTEGCPGYDSIDASYPIASDCVYTYSDYCNPGSYQVIDQSDIEEMVSDYMKEELDYNGEDIVLTFTIENGQLTRIETY